MDKYLWTHIYKTQILSCYCYYHYEQFVNYIYLQWCTNVYTSLFLWENEWVLAGCFHQVVLTLFVLWLGFLKYIFKPLGGDLNYSKSDYTFNNSFIYSSRDSFSKVPYMLKYLKGIESYNRIFDIEVVINNWIKFLKIIQTFIFSIS